MCYHLKHFPFHVINLHRICFHSCERGKHLFTIFDKIAENVNTRTDIQLGYVDCEADTEFCESNGVKGNFFSWTLQCTS